jgi:hypothetical protein
MLLSMALEQNWTDIFVGWQAVSSSRIEKIELWMPNMYAILPTVTETHQRMSILNVSESCGFGRLTQRSIQEIPVYTYLLELTILKPGQVPSGHTAPSSAVWLTDIRCCCVGTWIIALVSLCNHKWGVCIRGAYCVTELPVVWYVAWKFRIDWFFFSFAFYIP